MYKWAVRRMIRRNVAALNAGDMGPTLAMFHDGAELSFPGGNTWSRQFREPELGRDRFGTHRGRGEIGAFLQRFVDTGLQMAVEDVLVNGPPWRMRAAVRVRDWVPDPRGGSDRYCNRAVLWVTARWGKILTQEDFEDTERVVAFDALEREQQAP